MGHKKILMQNNKLVHTSCEDISVLANRIFYYCLFAVQKEKNGYCCYVRLREFESLVKCKDKSKVEQIKTILEHLKRVELKFKPNGIDHIECNYQIISGFEYNSKTEEFKIEFPQRLYEHIKNYTNYAPLNLSIMTKFSSFYAQKIYELLRLWSRNGKTITKSFKVDELKFICGVTERYSRYSNFKQRVLNQALKDINAHGNMEVSFKEIRKGRNVDKIEFTIIDYEPRKYFQKEKKENEENEEDNIENINLGSESKKEPEDDMNYNTEKIQESNSCVLMPLDKKIFDTKTLETFLDYCVNNIINFPKGDDDNLNILMESYDITCKKKNIKIIRTKDNSYSYFLGVFSNKYEEIRAMYEREIANDFNLAQLNN